MWQSYHILHAAQLPSFKTETTSGTTNMHVSFLVEDSRGKENFAGRFEE